MNKYQKVLNQLVQRDHLNRWIYNISFTESRKVWKRNIKDIDNSIEFMRHMKNEN